MGVRGLRHARQIYSRVRNPVSTLQGAGCWRQIWTSAENLASTAFHTTDSPAYNESL